VQGDDGPQASGAGPKGAHGAFPGRSQRTRWTRVVALVSQALVLCYPRLVWSW